MKLIKKNSVNYLTRLLESIGEDRVGWNGFLFLPADPPAHEDMITPFHHINGKLHKLDRHANALATALAKASPPMTSGDAFIFPGGVVVTVVRADLYAAYAEIARKNGATIRRLTDLGEEDVMAALDPLFKRAALYEAIADTEKVKSIGFRRNRHKIALILLVDDDHFTSTFAASMLKNHYDVVLVRSGDEGVAAHIKHAPNVVVLNIHVEGLGGLETLRTLRKLDPDAIVIVITGRDEDEQIFEAARAGAAGFVKKPMDKDRFLKAIREAPGMKRYASAGE